MACCGVVGFGERKAGIEMATSSAVVVTDAAVEQEFRQLTAKWREEMAGYALANRVLAHPAYRQIIEMGEAVLPLILEDLREGGGHWYRALREITGENPVPEEHRARRPQMRAAWVEWGKARGHLK